MSLRIAPPEVPKGSTELAAATLGRMFAEHYGCPSVTPEVVLRGSRLIASFHTPPSPLERQLTVAGFDYLIEDMRHAFQEAMAPQLKAAVEELTGHRVVSQTGSSGSDEQQWRLIFFLGPNGKHDA